MDRSIFFAALRERKSGVFGTSLSQKQVDGLDALLDAIEAARLPICHGSYVLATTYWETARSMYPNRENMNYSARRIPEVFGPHRLQGRSARSLARRPETLATIVYGGPWGQRQLGNRPGTNDGWIYRGGGMDHITGLANYKKAGSEISVDLVGSPGLILSPAIAARVIVSGMRLGRYRRRKLSDYDAPDKASFDYFGARAIINADVERNGAKIEAHAQAFERALRAAGYTHSAPPVPKTAPQRITAPKSQEIPPQGGFGAWAAALAASISAILERIMR